MSKKFAPALDFVARELAPLDAIPHRKLPTSLSEEDVLRTFFALNAPACPLLAHLVDYGFTLKTARDFLSTFAGQTISVPSRRTLARAWDDLQIWLAVEQKLTAGMAEDEARKKTASKLRLPMAKVEEVHTRFRKVHHVVGRLHRHS